MSSKTVMITGTKGKTTVSFLIDAILLALHDKSTLRVDTTGHFLNGHQRSTFADSKAIWGFSPTVCPGRYLYDLISMNETQRDNTVAVLEASLGCSNIYGTGLKTHDIGIWTNVMEDHLGSTHRLNSRQDIADAKDFVFRQIHPEGYAVFNACDELVCSKTGCINHSCTILPCVHDENSIFYDLPVHFASGGTAFFLRGTKIFQKTASIETEIYDAKNLPWTFDGQFRPSMINLMLTIAAIYGIYDGHFPDNLRSAVDSVRLAPYGGRLTVLRAKNGATIIADYAHEKESLVTVGQLAKHLADKTGGKTIGIVRLAYDRTDELIDKTGQAIGKAYDELVVYDKIDGCWRQPEAHPANTRFTQEVGKISGLLGAAIKKTNPNVTVILREDEAIDFAAKKAGKNDVVVMIVNDDIHRSIDWLKEKFQADFA